MSKVDWVETKLAEDADLKISGRSPNNFLIVNAPEKHNILVAVLGLTKVIELADVMPLFSGAEKPDIVINVPSATLWSGAAINYIHSESAAFGTLGDVSRAAATDYPGSFRDKKMGFFIDAIMQHRNVVSFSYIYDRVFEVRRRTGTDMVVAVTDAYNMSAEDVRTAKKRFGHFDILVKSSSYGSITTSALNAAKSIGAQSLTFGEMLGRLSS
jgi:hypothetical protein